MNEITEHPREKKKTKRARWFVLAIIIVGFVVGCPLFYMSGSVDGRIIDESTGQPIAIAHIVGIWELEGGLIEHAYLGPLYFEETITDDDGRYHLNGFFIRFIAPNLMLAQLENNDPIIYIFAVGYQPTGRLGTRFAPPNYGGIYRKSPLNGRDIALKRMSEMTKPEASKWNDTVDRMKNDLHRCDLAELPQIVTLLKKMQEEFKKVGSKYIFLYDDEYKNCR